MGGVPSYHQARGIALDLGMMCQGNLLGLDPGRIYLYSNTLQAIAMGYLIAPCCSCMCGFPYRSGRRLPSCWSIGERCSLLRLTVMEGVITRPTGNLAEWVDRTVLGRFRDAAVVENGQVVFAESYRYTWILSSLNFGVTVLTGLFAGQILKSAMDQKRKWQWLLGIGVAMVALGWLWGLQLPVIKKIWTSRWCWSVAVTASC